MTTDMVSKVERPAPTPSRRKALGKQGRQRASLGISVAAMAVFVAAWEVAPSLGLIQLHWSSKPSIIVATWWGLIADGTIPHHLAVSGQAFLYGYVSAVIVGIAVGYAMAANWWSFAIIQPYVAFFKSMPRVALIPIFVIWLGIGIPSKVAVIFLTTVFPVILNSYTGFKSVDASLLRVANAFKASRRRRFTTVVVPSAIPSIITGLRLGVGNAVIAVVYAEFYAAAAGIGFFIGLSGQQFRVDRVFSGILTISVIGLTFDYILVYWEKRFGRWRPV